MKKGLNFHLSVKFDGVSLDDVEKIEFAFSKNDSMDTVKTDEWPGTATRKGTENVILVPFTYDETRDFSGVFRMDTRITMKGTTDQPETPVLELEMNDTLFEEGRPIG